MKVAVVHDDLMRRGGAEQVVLSIMKAYPNADLFTLCYQADLTYEEFKNYKIRTSYYQYLVKTEKMMKLLFFPLGIICMKLLQIKNYDVVIVSSTFCGKYGSINRSSKIFLYTYTPFRLAWNPDSYNEYNNSKGISRAIFNSVIKWLRFIDKNEAQKANYHISMTKETAERVKIAYNISEIAIIHPAVKTNNFFVNAEVEKKYFLIVSRLEFYKKVDLAIEVFNELGLPLIIVGNGSKREELKAMANANIEFKSGLSSKQLAELYSGCKAFIFPQHEDYGITPLEANASGRPVIAYAKGGVLETMIPYENDSKPFTSIFFKEQTKESLLQAIKQLEFLNVNAMFIRSHAMNFDEEVFINELKKVVK